MQTGSRPALPPATTPADADALIREARRHQRIRYLITAAACLAVAGSGAGLYLSLHGTGRARPHVTSAPPSPASSHGTMPAPIPPIAAKVMMWPLGYPLGAGNYPGPPFVVADMRTGRYVQTGKVDMCCGDYQPLMITVGRWMVYVGNGATAIRDDLSGRPRRLGDTPFFAPAATRGDVWLEYLHGSAASIRLAPVAGGQPGPEVTLPAHSRLVAGTDAGLLLSVNGGPLRLWQPGQPPRPLPGAPSWEDGVAVTPRLIAYGTRCRWAEIPQRAAVSPGGGYQACSMLRVLDVRSERVRSFSRPAGTSGWVPPEFGLENPVSPSGSMIAAEAVVPSADHDRGRLYVLRLAGRHRPPVHVPASAGFLFSKAAWSPDGSWLFYQGPRGRLWGYRVRTGTVRSSTVPCCRYTVMAVVRAALTAAARRR